MSHNVLILDDEPDIRELLELTLSRMGISCQTAANLQEAYLRLERHTFDLCLTDMRLPDGEGIELVEYIQQHHPNLPCAVITAFGSTEMAVRSLKAGAFDFISKPVDIDNLRNLVNSALRIDQLSSSKQRSETTLIGESSAIQQVRDMIFKLSRNQAPVYISGESGTGKELVARQIHKNGPRHDKPFIAVNCGAIPSELIESELFGHKKGSFTGADKNKKGLFLAADGGTLFLDEIAELPLNMQVKLLRVIQERTVRAVGDEVEKNIDVRILSASNKDLNAMIANNKFRDDLYYRLNVIELALPPLRNRISDIRPLCRYIMDKRLSIAPGTVIAISEASLNALEQYTFPGNIRELENILERAAAMCEGNSIQPHDLNLQYSSDVSTSPAIFTEHSTKSPISSRDDKPLDEYIAEIEKNEIQTALDKARWNRVKASKLLGISVRQLRYKMSKLDISDQDES